MCGCVLLLAARQCSARVGSDIALPCPALLCRVTECPQIHSGGFHFNFDLQLNPQLGYVLPTWIGDQPLQPTLLQSLHSSVLTRLLHQHQLQEASGGTHAVAAAVEQVASAPAGPALAQLLGGSNMTLLHLPLKPGSEDVGQKLAQLRPTLLLFLRQLRCLVLSDAEAGTVSVAGAWVGALSSTQRGLAAATLTVWAYVKAV